ncbi:TIGR01777 family oxidoreductase [Arsenicicoccus sp. oral taxon 190]|uniref:TIGR01777 family oxidoreductase n=1 Tax=Arsenicicoccus sp. oral taxon 190 TaxID=1658671 RepID=UPI0009E3FA96|nr:TIGR01777 family oxidoreductase [Arsenicicoccus sp. oral taxon 190]
MPPATARRIAVTGASGLIGTELVQALRARGDEVLRLVRRDPTAPDERRWDPVARVVDPGLGAVDAVVNLAGAPVGRRWTASYRRELLDSRVTATRTAAALVARQDRPCVLLNASGVGYYGSDRGEELLTEASSPGTTFLADVVQQWEAATEAAADAGQRVVLARTGLVLSRRGGALGPMLPLARLGLAGPLGDGRQWWPWIGMADEVSALLHLLDHEVSGPVNLVAPGRARQAEVVRVVARALRRPAVLPAPAVAVRLALGGLADDVLGSQQVVPTALEQSGYSWIQPRLRDAVAAVVGPWESLAWESTPSGSLPSESLPSESVPEIRPDGPRSRTP